MGNAVRSTLGNLCGGQQAAKESPEDHERPVAKPKEVKKKEKKNAKKNKKEKNGDLIAPLNDGNAINNTENEISENQQQNKSNDVQESLGNEVSRDNQSDYDEAIEDEKESSADINEINNKNENIQPKHEEDNELSNEQNGVIQVENDGDKNNVSLDIKRSNSEDQRHENKEEVIIPTENKLEESAPIDFPSSEKVDNNEKATPSSSDSFDMSKDDLSSADEVEKNATVHYIFEIEPINPESIGITYADEIFNKSKSEYEPFVECANSFKISLVAFNSSVLPAEVSDFDKCWNAYLTLLDEEAKFQACEKPRTSSRSQVDICDISANLQHLRAAGLSLLDEIARTKPVIQQLLAEAGKVDVIEYVKGKMVEGEQLGITSKFSAPGKYRRNMKQLKKAVREIDGVEMEVNYIIRQLEEQEEQISKILVPKPQDELQALEEEEEQIVAESLIAEESEPVFPIEIDAESVIIPDKKSDKINVEILDSISKLPTMEQRRSTDLTKDHTDDKKLTLLEKSAEANIEDDKKSEPITYVIENIPEGGGTPPTASSTPIARKETFEIREIKTPREDVKVADEDHNTLDYGKYVFIDPTTGEIQTMRNRTRSLDSLVSMTSNRSSISRFGSFELVTDFEINIAEQNQQKLLTYL